MYRLVVDTNVMVAAFRTDADASGAARALLRGAVMGRYRLLFGNALWQEYRDLLDRPVWTAATSDRERRMAAATLAATSEWIDIYFRWRPNLPDEADNHLVELAVAGNADAIVTYNVDDLRRGELRWPDLKILTPAECLEQLS